MNSSQKLLLSVFLSCFFFECCLRSAIAEIQSSAELVAAVARHDSVAVEKLLIEGANPNSHGGDQNAPVLNAAVIKGDARIVDLLLQHKADPNIGQSGFTPMFWLASGGAIRGEVGVEIANHMARSLVKAGAKINQRGFQGKTPLHEAVTAEFKVPLALEFIRLGADPSIKDEEGKDALTIAIERNMPGSLLQVLRDPGTFRSLARIPDEASAGATISKDGNVRNLVEIEKEEENRFLFGTR